MFTNVDVQVHADACTCTDIHLAWKLEHLCLYCTVELVTKEWFEFVINR